MNIEKEIIITISSSDPAFNGDVSELITEALKPHYLFTHIDREPVPCMAINVCPATKHNFLELRNNNRLPDMEVDRTDET